MDKLIIGGRVLPSRLMVGTAGCEDFSQIDTLLKNSQASVVTVSVGKVNKRYNESIIEYLKKHDVYILPNTAGAISEYDALFMADISLEILSTNWVKLEVIDPRNGLNYTNGPELLKAAKSLIDKGVDVLAYTNDDPVLAEMLMDIGCSAIMPMGSPIGSCKGLLNEFNLSLIRKRISIPLIIDAGIGSTSHIARAMELGYDGILLSTFLYKTFDIELIAKAIKYSTIAGRYNYLATHIG